MVSLNAQRKRCASVQAVDAYLEALTYARRYALFTLVGEPFLSGDPILPPDAKYNAGSSVRGCAGGVMLAVLESVRVFAVPP